LECENTYDPPKRRFKPEPRGATSQKTIFFIVIAVKTSNLTEIKSNWRHDTQVENPCTA
jgi:hypothetical protein